MVIVLFPENVERFNNTPYKTDAKSPTVFY